MAWGDKLINKVKSRIKALNDFNRREEIRLWIGLRILLILLVSWVYMEVQAIIAPNVYTYTTEAATLNPIEVSKTSVEVKAISVASPEEVIGSEDKTSLPAVEIEQMIARAFPEASEKAIEVFKCESELDASTESITDRTADNRAFSAGLAQINFSVTKIGELDCPSAFKGSNYKATVVNEKLYQQCLKEVKKPQVALEIAKKKYNSRGNFSAWYYCSNHKI